MIKFYFLCHFATASKQTQGCYSIHFKPTGLIAMNTDWPATDYAQKLIKEDYKLAVPLSLLYLTPPAVAFIGENKVS